MDYNSVSKKEKIKRRRVLIKLMFLIIFLLIIVLIIMRKKVNNVGIGIIGESLSISYSKDNFTYFVQTDDIENEEYFLIKKLDDQVYYEKNRKVGREYLKDIYYFDLNQDKAWKILEDEKIILTDEYIPFEPEVVNNVFLNFVETYAENYALYNYNLNKPSEKIRSLKKVNDKKIDDILCFEVVVDTTQGLEKTYFNKDNYLPIKTILETEKNGNIVKNITITFEDVTSEDFKVIDDYKKMTTIDYKEYKRVVGL